MRRLLLTLVAASAVSPLVAAPPDVKYLTPAGAQSGRETEVRASGTFAKWPVKTWVSGTGVRFEPKKDSGKFAVHVDADVPPGLRWVRFVSDDGASLCKAFVIGAIAEQVEKEPNETRAKAKKLDGKPVVINGALGTKGDVDMFGVSLKAGQTLVAAVDANAAFGSIIDCALQLTDAAGNVLAQNVDERGFDPRIVFVAPSDGDYYVRLFGIAAVPNSSISFAGAEDAIYRLTLTTEAFVDHVWPPAVPLGTEAQATLRGWNLSEVASPTKVDLREGMQPIRVPVPHGAAGRAVAIGVDVPTIIETESSAAGEEPRALVAPAVVNARFERPRDRDEYVVTAKKGQVFRLRIVSQAYGFPADVLVKIYKPDGTPPLRVDDISKTDADIDTLLQCPLDGDYRLAVEELFGNGGENYAYLLDLRPVGSEFGLSLAAAEINTVVGKPFELTVNVDRPTGNVSDIEVRIEGLPEKFGATPVVSGGDKVNIKTTGKQVKLKFTPTEKFEGPIRVIGVLKGEAEVKRAATAGILAIPGARVNDIWLHAGPEQAPSKPADPKKK